MKRSRARNANGRVIEVVITDILGDTEARIKNRAAAIKYVARTYREDGLVAFHTQNVSRLECVFGTGIVTSAIKYLRLDGVNVPKFVPK